MDQRIARPSYDRGKVTPGILHVGLGNFHRAHQAIYLDDLVGKEGASGWGILGAGVMPGDAAMRGDLEGQDWLYSVSEQDADGDAVRVVGVMTGFLPVETGHGAIIKALDDPSIRILSLTVTEGGYFMDPSKGGFDAEHPSILADIANPDAPTTVFGAIVAGLRARRAAGAKPFTVMCCDNLPHNGAVTRRVVMGVAEGQDKDLAKWIADTVTFPNGMVDRITPATSPERRAGLARDYGLDDTRPVFCEPFRQWVLEDNFCDGRPDLDSVGVQFVPDVAPFENMKIRMLNGGHAVIAYPAGLMDVEYVHEAMEHPLVAAFLEKVEREEIVPMVPPVPDTSLDDYLTLIRGRFGNPRIGDTVRRLCLDGSNRQPKFIVPSIIDNRKAGKSVPGLALESALWCRYCAGTTDSGAAIAPNDPSWDRLTELAKAAKSEPSKWLAMGDVYGDLGQDTGFADAFAGWLGKLWKDGTAATLRDYLGRS
ncbi:MAG: mannitol dehydrogenase family protein [Rhodobacteraceae bacterium]|nr:mannitol dehydrogenase family protein [Paracoccaceae bacterium]